METNFTFRCVDKLYVWSWPDGTLKTGPAARKQEVQTSLTSVIVDVEACIGYRYSGLMGEISSLIIDQNHSDNNSPLHPPPGRVSDHQCDRALERAPPPLHAQRKLFNSSSWVDWFRISDRKFVNHTTEMILWSMILMIEKQGVESHVSGQCGRFEILHRKTFTKLLINCKRKDKSLTNY